MATQASRHATLWGLLAILVGIVAGGLLGATYGRTMWLASGGPQARLDQLQKTIQQKGDFAQQAEDRAEESAAQGDHQAANRARAEAHEFREDVQVIRGEITRVETLRDHAAERDLWFAGTISEIVRFLGDVFLRLLKMMVVPLVFTSMVCGVTSLGNIRRLGKIGLWTLVYYLSTSAAAVVLGIMLVQWIQPGRAADDTFAYLSERVLAKQQTTALGTLLEVVVGTPADPGSGMIPDNIVLAAAETNVLAVILFALVFGGAVSALGEKSRPVVGFFQAANDAIMKIIHMIIWLAPVGIFGLVATRIADAGGGSAFYDELMRLGWFVCTVLTGLAIHAAVLSGVLWVFARRNPLVYLYGAAKALLTAFSTGSSSATLPVTMECVQQSGVSPRSAGFVLPLGATINMDGTALYEAVAAIFIAQSLGVPLDGAALVIVFVTATLAAIGAPGIPEAGLVTMLIVLAAVGLPAAGIGTILAIDWFLDRNRTALNVFGDTVGAAIIDRHFGQVGTVK